MGWNYWHLYWDYNIVPRTLPLNSCFKLTLESELRPPGESMSKASGGVVPVLIGVFPSLYMAALTGLNTGNWKPLLGGIKNTI